MSDAILYPSLGTLLVGLVLLVFWSHSLRSATVLVFGAGLSLLLIVVYAVANSFTGGGIDQSVIFHLTVVLGIDELIQFWDIVAVVVLLLASYVVLCKFVVLKLASNPRICIPRPFGVAVTLLSPIFIIASIAVNPAVFDGMDLYRYYKNQNIPDRISDKIASTDVKLVGAKKNFIYIYAESLERKFFDTEQFPGLLPNLSALLRQEALSFEGIKQLDQLGWTISGMTGTQCGVPIGTGAARPARNNFVSGDGVLAGAHCVGDVLRQNDYFLEYIGGASGSFAGKKRFYEGHGFDRILMMEEIDAMSEKMLPKSKWGIYDDALFELALQEVESIKQHPAYGLVLLTLDTHSPSGHRTPACNGLVYGNGESNMLNAVHCADRLIFGFLSNLLADDDLNDTIIFLSSDHLMMSNDAGLAYEDTSRENLFAVFNSGSKGSIRKVSSMLDVAPTWLSYLGFEAESYALGRSLLSSDPTVAEELGVEALNDQLNRLYTIFWDMWEPERLNSG